MHIVYVSADQGIPAFGCKGASVHIQEMIRAFGELGAKVTLMSPRLEGRPPADLADLAQVQLPVCDGKDSIERARVSIASNEVIADALSTLEPYDLVYERHSLFTDAPMQVARQAGVPGVLEVNAPLIEEQARHRVLPQASQANDHADLAFSAASIVSVVSPEIIAYATAHGAHPDRVHVLENGVNLRRFPRTPRPYGPFTVGFLGTLKPWHDVTTLVDSFELLQQRHSDAQLLIIGDGPERGALEAQVERLKLGNNVEFTGVQKPADVPRQLARLHVGVAPYRRNPSFYFSPLKIYEYMAAGLPVLVSCVGHLDSLVDHERNGLLCPPEDAQALATALIRLAGEPALARRLGRAARQDMINSHDWKAVAARILNLATEGSRLTATT